MSPPALSWFGPRTVQDGGEALFFQASARISVRKSLSSLSNRDPQCARCEIFIRLEAISRALVHDPARSD
jgi:hypothetical protein